MGESTKTQVRIFRRTQKNDALTVLRGLQQNARWKPSSGRRSDRLEIVPSHVLKVKAGGKIARTILRLRPLVHLVWTNVV
jgi:hypothetical protein